MLLLQIDSQLSPELIDRRSVSVEVLGRSTSQKHERLGGFSARDHLVVVIDFSVSLLEQWQPPRSVACRPGEGDDIVVSWEKIVDGDLFGSAFHIDSQGKDALLIVLVLVEQIGDRAVHLA